MQNTQGRTDTPCAVRYKERLGGSYRKKQHGYSSMGALHADHRRSVTLLPHWENKLRKLAEENKHANWLIRNGNRIQIKRKQFEKIIDEMDAI